MLESKRKLVQLIKRKHDVISAHTIRLKDVNIVTKCKFSFSTSLKLSALKWPCRSQSQRVTSLSQLHNVFKAFSYKEICKNERVTVLKHFIRCLSSFQLKIKLAKVKEWETKHVK